MIDEWDKVATALRDTEEQLCRTFRSDTSACWAGIQALASAKLRIVEAAHGSPGFHGDEFLKASTWYAP